MRAGRSGTGTGWAWAPSLVGALLVVLAGCTSSKGAGSVDPVTALEESAGDAAHEGQADAAAETLERAIRLDPTSAGLWLRLARVRLQEGRADQAESLARKSMSLAPGDEDLHRASWLLIAEAREARGDVTGAAEAREKAR